MTLSDISIKNSVFAWMLMAALILFGAISGSELGISQMPDVDLPIVSIHITYEGASPEIMESDVVDIVEDSLTTIQGIRNISSTSQYERASISVEFDLGRNIDIAVQEIQTKLSQVQRRLPADIEPPIVSKTNPEDQPIMWLALSADKPRREIMTYARDHLKSQFQTIDGVGEIFLGGYVEPMLRVWIDHDKLAKYELTVHDVLGAIRSEHVEIPAGRIDTAEKEYTIRSLSEAGSLLEFKKIRITKRGGAAIYHPIYISDVATVELGLDDIRSISRTAGKTAMGLGIKKQRGSNAVAVANAVKERLKEIEKMLPPGYAISINFDDTQFIQESTDEMKFTLALSAILTGIVCLLFLASWGATFNVLMAIPTSIIGSFLFLHFFGFTLNTFTLLGLILSIGIVVDDAIMVLENIVRHQEMGKKPMRAAIDGAREITPAAVATTLALIAIFVPVVFMKGVIGKFFFQFGVTMSIAVALSLLEALTLTPMRCSRFLVASRMHGPLARRVNQLFLKLSNGYLMTLRYCLNNRWKIIFGATLFFMATFTLIFGLKKEFSPTQDTSSFMVRLQTPLGSSIAFTDKKVKEVEHYFASQPEVLRYYAAVGGFGGGNANSAMMFVTLKSPKDRQLNQEEFMNMARKELSKIPDLKPIFQDMSMRGLTSQRGFPVEFTIRGPDWNKLIELSETMIEKMKENRKFIDVDSDYQEGQPEIRISPDRQAAAARGISMKVIGETIQALMGGVPAGKFTEHGHRDDIRIRLKESERQGIENFSAIRIRNDHGQIIPLRDVVTITETTTLKSITRRDRERAIGLFSNIATDQSLSEALKEIGTLASQHLPEGYRVVLGGATETFTQSFQSLLFALILGIIVAYMVLGSQYNSFLHPILVLLALPFSISGAFMSLSLFDQSLNLYSFIGIILLMGLVKKNSILLVDFTNQRRHDGMTVTEALLTACPQRLRPILMTSIATMAAALPPALGVGPGSETRIPMAVVILGGMSVSTIFTLFVVPCAYSLMVRFERRSSEELR